LNVLTGETGAGKSIVVDALGLASGERGDSALIRSGTDRAVIEARSSLRRRGPWRRCSPRAGSTRTGRADRPPGASRLGVGARARQRIAFDGFRPARDRRAPGGSSRAARASGAFSAPSGTSSSRRLRGARRRQASVAAASREAVEAEARLTRLLELGREGRARAEALRETLREIRAVDPKPGELEALRRDRVVLQNGSKVAALLDEAIGHLDEGEQPAIASAYAAERRIAELGRIDPSLEPLAARAGSARLELEDVRDTLTAYRDRADFDPSRLEALESRRAALERLLLKFGPTEEDASSSALRAERELATIDHLGEEVGGRNVTSPRRARPMRAPPGSLQAADGGFGAPRSGGRSRARAPGLREGSIRDRPDAVSRSLASGGSRARRVPLAANPGEPARPIGKAASGGELSRLMLALHVVLEAASSGRVLVFDEVDAGVSGGVAVAVGARLARLAARHQVLCVTHLPQVAAHGAGHYHVSKRVAAGRTHTEIVPLTGDARRG
jgi:DNA repair protein RecN (Recombination protein N)